jgi:hypothetical protein
MKNQLSALCPEQYDMGTDEIVAAAALKMYLQGLSPELAERILSDAVKPTIIQLGRIDHGRRDTALPLQSVIDGKALAALIDDAVASSVEEIRATEEGTPENWERAASALRQMTGARMVATMSCEFAKFVVDCYRAVKY